MRLENLRVLGLILIQLVALVLYPLSFFQNFPQSSVLPSILVIINLLTLIGVYTRTINPITGRISMVFTQGVNMVMRVITLFPNLITKSNEWNGLFILLTLASIVLSWYSVVMVEKKTIKPGQPGTKK